MSELLYKETQLDLFEDSLPPETLEKGCDSFDDLVLSTRYTCHYGMNLIVRGYTLSDEQKRFMLSSTPLKNCTISYDSEKDLFFLIRSRDDLFLDVSFNDIFIHKDDVPAYDF